MHLRTNLFLTLVLCTLFSFAQGEPSPKKTYTTTWTKEAITIDGKLDDDAWNQVEWGGDFVGFMPEFNVEPTQETQFKVLHDAKFIYVAIRAFDTEPDKIQRRMTRRDGFDGDRVTIMLDSYYDKRTAFSFTACASGVKGEEYVSNNGDNWDSTWDPIWYLKTSIDEKGWVAEFKIPLSQLRFANKESHVWGLQVSRNFFRGQEQNTWQPIDPNAQGWVHLFGELNGIKGIKPQKQLEIQPYRVESINTYESEPQNPYRFKGREYNSSIGVDAKIGITSDITLDLTINPDFGQVDADPSVVNLSAFQLFFRERRPFFLEGASLLSFQTSGGPNDLFYSRRIGSNPSGSITDEDIEFIDRPQNVRILTSAKITGKNAQGFSWGFLDALTQREFAEVIDTLGNIRDELVEPLTNYAVGRLQQDINGGKTVVGALATHVSRFDNNINNLDLLHDDALSAGVDIDHNFKDRKYGFGFKAMFSRVSGTQGAIYRTQRAPQRNFQRPDNFYEEVDSSRTSLTGSAMTVSFGKRSGNWRWTVGSNFRSPEFAINDIGFLQQTDVVNNWLWTQYRIPKITRFFRSQRYNLYTEINSDFGGAITNKGVNFNMNWQFKNFWEYGQGFWLGGSRISNADLRGGPSFRYPGNFNYWTFISTNRSRKISASINPRFNWGNNNFRKSRGLSLNINARPTDALQISLSPSVNWTSDNLQWVSRVKINDDPEYILSTINRETYNLSLRVNYNITPNLTIEFWGQPFLAKGAYSDYKQVLQADAESNSDQYLLLGDRVRMLTEEEFREINTDPDAEYDGGLFGIFDSEESELIDHFENPNFSRVSLQTNMVVRWEYIPGSTIFLGWSKGQRVGDYMGSASFNDLASQLTQLSGNNTFLIKYTYRFIL